MCYYESGFEIAIRYINIIFVVILVSSCENNVERYLDRAEGLAEVDPEASLACLDSLSDKTHLKLDEMAKYYFLKWHATFMRDGELENLIVITKVPEFLQKKGDKHKAAYAFLYNGILANQQGLFKQAAICLNEAQKSALSQNDSLLIFYTYYYQGKLFFRNREFHNGELAFQKALKYQHNPHSSDMPHYLLKIANCYLYTRNYDRFKELYKLVLQNMDNNQDSTITAKMLFLASHNVRNKEMKGYLADYLRNKFNHDGHTQIYNKLVNAEVCLRGNDVNLAYQYLSDIPKDSIPKMPEILLQYYRMQGKYYFQKGEYEKAFRFFRRYFHVNDSLRVNLFDNQVNSVVSEYTRSKLENEISLLLAHRISLILGCLVLLLLCLLVCFWAYILKKKKNEKILEAEMLIDTLQNLCHSQRNKHADFKSLLINKLEVSRQLINLSSREIPRNVSLLKMYDEMIGDIYPSKLNWEEFYRLIDCLYDDLHKKLPLKFPELTEREIQTICLLCGGFKTDEIAFVMNQTVAAIHKRKTFIRKKLNLGDRADIAGLIIELLEK